MAIFLIDCMLAFFEVAKVVFYFKRMNKLALIY